MEHCTVHYLQGVPCFRNKFCKAHFCATIVTRKEKHCQNCFSWSKMMMMIVNIGKANAQKGTQQWIYEFCNGHTEVILKSDF